MNKQRELVEAYAEFLQRFTWDWFATLTFRGDASPFRANRVFNQWIFELKRTAGTQGFIWFRVAEGGSDGDNLHFHVLIGGLRVAEGRERWARRWDALAGDAKIDPYDPGQDGVYYILKDLDPDTDFDFEMNLGSALVLKSWEGDL